MAHVEGPTSRARASIGLASKQTLDLAGVGGILFRERLPLAVRTGGYVYFPDFTLTQGEARAINEFSRTGLGDTTQVRVPVETFDFIVGQVLAQAGLRLTALPKEPRNGEA